MNKIQFGERNRAMQSPHHRHQVFDVGEKLHIFQATRTDPTMVPDHDFKFPAQNPTSLIDFFHRQSHAALNSQPGHPRAQRHVGIQPNNNILLVMGRIIFL